MSIPDHIISSIKDRVDIVQLVQAHVPLKKAGTNNYSACCPFHEEKTPSFTVSSNKQFYHCFGCGAHGDQIDWLVNYLGVPWSEAVARLAESAGVSLPENNDSGRVKAKTAVFKTLDKAARWMWAHLLDNRRAKQYVMDERKVSTNALEQFMIGYAPRAMPDYLAHFSKEELQVLVQAGVLGVGEDGARMFPKLGGRIIFPIRDAAGWVIGFSGRLLGEGQPKYMNSPDSPFFSKRNEIFRAPDVRREARMANRVVVTEGYFDVVSLFDVGIGYTVAGMGTATTPENLESMFSLASEVVFCFDGDAAGRTAAWKALLASMPVIGDNRLASFAFLPGGMDPDEFIRAKGKAAFTELLDDAQPLSKFFIDAYRGKKEQTPMEKHSALMEQAAKQIRAVSDSILRNGLAASLGMVFGVPVSTVQRAGGFGAAAKAVSTLPAVRADALETNFLSNLVRRPWEAGCLPGDVELKIPGGTEIVGILRAAKLSEVDGTRGTEILRATPYWPLVERLMNSGELDDDVPRLAKRIEAAWLVRVLDDVMGMPPEMMDRTLVKGLVARKFTVMGEIEKCKMS